MTSRRLRLAASLVLLAVLAAACGARLSEEEQLRASAGPRRAAAAPGEATSGGTGEPLAGDATGVDSGTGAAAPSGDGGTDTGSAGGTTDAGGGDATGGSGGSEPGSGPAGGGAAAPAPTAPPGGNGGATDVGVTATEISLGNVSTLSGPVPGLFKGAVVGAQAFIAYQNSKGGVHGRKLKLKVGDDRLSSEENRAQHIKLSPQVFAFLGSFSVYDDAGVAEMQKQGVPDVGYGLSRIRYASPLNFSPQPIQPGWRLGPLKHYKQTYGDAVIKKVGALVANVQSAKDAWAGQEAAMRAEGFDIIYEREFQPTETDFTADVVQMRRAGVEMLVMSADYASMVRVAKSMAGQQYKPKLMNWGANAYDARFISIGKDAVEGSIIDQQLSMYLGEDRAVVPEIGVFLEWVNKVAPGHQNDIFTAFSWAAGHLFVQALEAAGPRATRAGLLEQLKKVNSFDAKGMLPPTNPAAKKASSCYILIKVQNQKFVRLSPASGYRCDGGYFSLP